MYLPDPARGAIMRNSPAGKGPPPRPRRPPESGAGAPAPGETDRCIAAALSYAGLGRRFCGNFPDLSRLFVQLEDELREAWEVLGAAEAGDGAVIRAASRPLETLAAIWAGLTRAEEGGFPHFCPAPPDDLVHEMALVHFLLEDSFLFLLRALRRRAAAVLAAMSPPGPAVPA